MININTYLIEFIVLILILILFYVVIFVNIYTLFCYKPPQPIIINQRRPEDDLTVQLEWD